MRRIDIPSTLQGRADLPAVVDLLWKRAAPSLSEGELAGIAGAGIAVSECLDRMAELMEAVGCVNVGCMASEDSGVQPIEDASALMFPIAEQLKALASLSALSAHAAHRLLEPSQYRKGGPLHGL